MFEIKVFPTAKRCFPMKLYSGLGRYFSIRTKLELILTHPPTQIRGGDTGKI